MSLPVLRENADTVRLFDPATGEEVILPDATTDKLAELRDWIRSTEEDLRIAKRALDAEMIGRMDKEATWSTTVGGYKISAPSPAPSTEYDAVDLRHGLEELQEDGLISLPALNAAVEMVVTYKVSTRGINALRKLGGRVAETIDAFSRPVEKERRVRVERVS